MPFDTGELARFLIGKVLVRKLAEGVAAGRIVETEAYVVGDPAGHAYRGKTLRNQALFLERGRAYVYLAYGLSFMLNVSSERAGVGAGVLIRAIEPSLGVAIMERNRGIERVRDLARAPDGCAKPWRLIAGWTGSISVAPARCGLHPTVRRRTKSGGASGSALRARPTVLCDSIFGAIGSSAAPRPSTNERKSDRNLRRLEHCLLSQNRVIPRSHRASLDARLSTGRSNPAERGRLVFSGLLRSQ
jgi:hypothetical protein